MTRNEPTSTPTQNETTNFSRRRVLASSIALATTGLAGCSGSEGSEATDTPTEEPTATPTEMMTEEPTEEPTPEPVNPDVPILNYALTLEHLENAFYRDGLDTFSDDELMEADALSEFGEAVRMDVPEFLKTVGAHEAAHVDALTDTVEQLGGDPVGEAEYDFGYQTPSEFLGVGKALENTGVAAYKGAAPTVSNDDIFAAAIGIHSVEARHAAFLNELNVESPFPAGVDQPKTLSEVKEIAGQFIQG